MQYLLPFITALPVTITGAPTGVIVPTKININTASESILLALGGSVGEDFVAAVLDGRGRGSHFSSVENFWSNLDQRLLLTRSQIEQRWPSTLLDVRSDFFQLYLEVLLGDIHIQVKSIIDLRGSKRKDPTILAREIVVVPKFLPAAATENQPLLSDEAADGDDQQDDLYRVQTACEVIGV